jgi:large subunit ribosomal protein L18e
MGLQATKSGKKNSYMRTVTRSKNLYINLLIKIYRFLAKKTKSRFNVVIFKRLFTSRSHQSPISLSRLVRYSKHGKIIVIVGKILNDERNSSFPKMTICALKFSSSARERVLKNGGKIITFDQLAKINPTGKDTLLLRGPNKRKSLKKKRNIITKKTN